MWNWYWNTIACNKIRGIRAAVCTDRYMAEMTRHDNNANVLCLGARLGISKEFRNIEEIVDSFIHSFYDGGRHDRRLSKIKKLEDINIGEEKKYGNNI